MLEALDKLREYAHEQTFPPPIEEIADEIEAEIADNYMCLPVDADGVPIHVGDELFNKNKPTDVYKVTAIADNGYIRIYHDTAHIHSSQCRHVKPRTLEDVLIEYRLKAYNLYACQELTGDERVNEFMKLDAEYDSEIRELLGGDV